MRDISVEQPTSIVKVISSCGFRRLEQLPGHLKLESKETVKTLLIILTKYHYDPVFGQAGLGKTL